VLNVSRIPENIEWPAVCLVLCSGCSSGARSEFYRVNHAKQFRVAMLPVVLCVWILGLAGIGKSRVYAEAVDCFLFATSSFFFLFLWYYYRV